MLANVKGGRDNPLDLATWQVGAVTNTLRAVEGPATRLEYVESDGEFDFVNLGVAASDGLEMTATMDWLTVPSDERAFIDAHSPFGPLSDLACPVPEAVPQMLSMHRRCIAICAEFGVKSITIHVGRPTSFSNDTEALFANILRSTEALLPAAEEAGVVICTQTTA